MFMKTCIFQNFKDAHVPQLLPGNTTAEVTLYFHVLILLTKHYDYYIMDFNSLTQEPEVPGSIPGPATYFCFSFR